MSEKNRTEKIYAEIKGQSGKLLCDCDGINEIDQITDSIPSEDNIKNICIIFRALADEKRIKILSMLEIEPLCVCIIKSILEISDSRLSYHLSILKKAGLISGEQKGTWITYSLTQKGKKWLLSGKNNVQ
ncbi:ArsR/SmtB family transcription factor [Methanoplanus limicola]|uniref:Transcriptional regulator, ArsR family n=1 Tax=Methanoplanus limicola DSM 2279 TaxID=937775 RepID=H1Z204_9EURY|nr:metalloregulator ArsR/SmtB family transcription factor [Methanoplanus limicola]EHQ36349.1 transcriptional regulator, ArsR family [Methanoplanus limicola DSM 2279]